MKKSLFLSTVLLAACTSVAAAQDQSFYAGLGLGRSSADVTEISSQDILDTGFSSLSAFQSGSSKSDTAWRIYGGYRFNANIAGELYYSDLGTFSRDASGTGVISSPPPINFSLNSDLKVTGFGAAVLLGMPLADKWSVFAKPGLLYWDAKRTSTTVASGSTQSGSVDKNGTSPSIGVGAGYAITDKLSARLEWERFFDVGDKNTTDKSDINLFALSLQFTP